MDSEKEVGAFKGWLQSLSLRAWLFAGFLIALLPIATLSVFWYLDYRDKLYEPLQHVLTTQHDVSVSLERIQAKLWDISTDVNDYVQTGDERYRNTFESTEGTVAKLLRDIENAVGKYPGFAPVLDGVQQQWKLLLEAATDVEAQDNAENRPLIRFESVIGETGKRIETIAESMRLLNEKSHAEALEAMERLDRFAAIAAALALVFSGLGIFVIDQALIRSTDKLVEGAMLIAQGDRSREIEVKVPPELASVGRAFNTMLQQITRQENALAAAARADGLTGLDNRREFDKALEKAIEQAQSDNEPFSLLMIDVDHFKQFNDTYGHLAGDDALRQVAMTIANTARTEDRAYRFGGEEFALILPGLRAYEAGAVAERLRSAVDGQVLILPDGQERQITVSVGVSVFRPKVSQPNIVELADRALYNAKSEGRNKVKITG